MKDQPFLECGLLLLVALLAGQAGCATGAPATSVSDSYQKVCGTDYHCVQDKMFEYRDQAAQLTLMAERYAREAEVKAKELGQNADEVRKTQAMAQKLWSQAQEADQLAQEYQRQIPHNAY